MVLMDNTVLDRECLVQYYRFLHSKMLCVIGNRGSMKQVFEEIDFHDDTLVSISIKPSESDSDDSIFVTLYRHWEKRTRVLEFYQCGNVSLRIDFNVLRDNAPSNTCGFKRRAKSIRFS